MADYHGDIRLGDTIDMAFPTTLNGLPATLSGTPSVAAYVGNGTTEITAGITLTVDLDSRVGNNNVRVVATSGNGYATASDISIVITQGTIGGSSVAGLPVLAFSIEKRSALMPTTAARTLDVTATGAAGIDWANVENPTTTVNLSATNIDVDQVVASVSGAVGSVTGNIGGNLNGSVLTNVVGNIGGGVAGDLGGSVLGGVVGNVGGNVNGHVVGDVQGNVDGSVDSVTQAVDANITQINGTTVTGDGSATPWGPL
jgi:hypothetical protein